MHNRLSRHRRHLPVFCLILSALVLAWTGAAMWFQVPDGWQWAAIALPVVLFGALVALSFKGRRWAWLGLLGVTLIVGVWFATIAPSQDRDWAPDVARGVTARIEGDTVYLHNVRDFEWTTRDDATERWGDKTVSLDQLDSVDLFLTTWGNPNIAHTMLSFGFSDGQYVVLSAEIRRERTEAFSEVGGFFKEFELVLIGATERDIVRLRTNERKDDVSIYRLQMTPEQRRDLFMEYLQLGNDLERKPRWYQTITTNCTTVIYKLARLVHPGLPLDWRILVSGHVQDYLYDIGVISNDRPLSELKRDAHITPKAQALPAGADYSQGIRAQ